MTANCVLQKWRTLIFVVTVSSLIQYVPLQHFRGEGQVVEALAPQSSLPPCLYNWKDTDRSSWPKKERDDCYQGFMVIGGVGSEMRPRIFYNRQNQTKSHNCEMPEYISPNRDAPWGRTKPVLAPALSVAECLADESLTVQIYNSLGPCDPQVTIPCIEDLQMRSVTGLWFSGAYVGEPSRHPSIALLQEKWGPFPELETGVERMSNLYTFPGIDPTQLYEVKPMMRRAVRARKLDPPTSLDVFIRGVKPITRTRGWTKRPSSEDWVAHEIECYSFGADCWQYTRTPIDNQFRLVLRLPVKPKGWLTGRLFQAEVKFERLDGVTTQPFRLTLAGSPVPTPRIVRYYKSDVAEEKHDCDLIRNVLLDPTNFQHQWLGDGCFTPGAVSYRILPEAPSLFADLLAADPKFDQATYIVDEWEVRIEQTGAYDKCDTGGFLGFVGSNAMTYSERPVWNPSGSLDYVVAGPHFQPDNSLFIGYYTAILAREYAACRWELPALSENTTSPNFRASLSVIEQDGTSSNAVTIIGVDKDFVKLSASGFTYSQKTMRIKLSAKTTSPRKATRKVICVKGKKSLQLTDHKSCPKGFKLEK